jgi:hypothetical protein
MSRTSRERVAGLLALAAVAAVAPARGLAEEALPAAGGALRISADPPRLSLGTEPAAELHVATPPGVEDLELSASVGRVDAVRRLPGGGFAARWRPPAERVPQVAIVAAQARTARGVEDGWLAIPVSGRGEAKVHGEPGSLVTLRVGERTFGPATTGPDGVAVVPVIVPPGVREAHQGFRPLDLRVPETPLLHAVADRVRVRADREERVRVVAYVVAPHGAARSGDAPAFEPTRGAVAVAEREPGAFVATWTLPPGAAGEERLAVRLPGAAASRAVVRIETLAGPPALVAVTCDRDALVAGGEPAAVTARALDAAGNPTAAALVLSARGGVLGRVEVRRPGEVAATLSAGTRLSGAEAVVTATVPALGVSGSRAVALRPADAAAAAFAPVAVVRGDGERPAVLRLDVADRFGNPVAVTPAVQARRGTVQAVEARGDGRWDVRYVPPAAERAAPDEIVARAGAAEALATPLVAPPRPAFTASTWVGPRLALRGGATALAAGGAAERALDVAPLLARGLDLALRLEGEVVRGPRETAGAALAGATARATFGRVDLAASASAGLGLGGGAAPAGRLGLALGIQLGPARPFVEASLLGAGPGHGAGLPALGVSAGVTFALDAPRGRTHGDPADRR